MRIIYVVYTCTNLGTKFSLSSSTFSREIDKVFVESVIYPWKFYVPVLGICSFCLGICEMHIG